MMSPHLGHWRPTRQPVDPRSSPTLPFKPQDPHAPATGSHVSLSYFPLLSAGPPCLNHWIPHKPANGSHTPTTAAPTQYLTAPPSCLQAPDPVSPGSAGSWSPALDWQILVLCFKSWISKLNHWTLDLKKPQPRYPDNARPRSWDPIHWITNPLPLTTGFLESLLPQHRGPRSCCFQLPQFPHFKHHSLNSPNHGLQIPSPHLPDPHSSNHILENPMAEERFRRLQL